MMTGMDAIPYNPTVTWAAAVVVVVAGVLSTWVLRDHPRWAVRAAAVMAGAGVTVVANEALGSAPTAYVGAWVLVAGTTFMNWRWCRRAECQHRRRIRDTLDLLAELERMHRERARMMADEALTRRGESPRDHHGVGIWPTKEC